MFLSRALVKILNKSGQSTTKRSQRCQESCSHLTYSTCSHVLLVALLPNNLARLWLVECDCSPTPCLRTSMWLHKCHSRAGPFALLTSKISRWETSGTELNLTLSQGFLVSLKYAYSAHFPHYLVLYIEVQPPGDSRPYLCHPSTVAKQAGTVAAQGGEEGEGLALFWHSLSCHSVSRSPST